MNIKIMVILEVKVDIWEINRNTGGYMGDTNILDKPAASIFRVKEVATSGICHSIAWYIGVRTDVPEKPASSVFKAEVMISKM
jgi:hypothetical protein